MDGEAERTGLPATCPSCGASVRGDVSWCTQCYAALRPQEQQGRPVDGPAAVPDPPRGGGRPEVAEDAGAAAAASGRTADPAEVERLAEQMLAKLAVERDDVHGLASRVPRTAGARALLVTLVIVVGSALVLLAMFVLGSVL